MKYGISLCNDTFENWVAREGCFREVWSLRGLLVSWSCEISAAKYIIKIYFNMHYNKWSEFLKLTLINKNLKTIFNYPLISVMTFTTEVSNQATFFHTF